MKLHPELLELVIELQEVCQNLEINVNELVPVTNEIITALPDGTVIGNWPMYRRATNEKRQLVRVESSMDLAFEDPALVTLRALTSVANKDRPDRLLQGLIYRRWRDYEERTVERRARRSEESAYRELHGCTHRQHLQNEISRRLGVCVRDMQRFAYVLDLPWEWLKLQRNETISFSVLERIAGMPAAMQDDLTDELRAGANVQELVEFYGLKPSRNHHRVTNAVEAFIRQLSKGVDDLHGRIDDVRGIDPAQFEVLRRAEATIQQLQCKPIRQSNPILADDGSTDKLVR